MTKELLSWVKREKWRAAQTKAAVAQIQTRLSDGRIKLMPRTVVFSGRAKENLDI